MRDCETNDCPTPAGYGLGGADAALAQANDKQGEWAKQREEQEFNSAFQVLLRADQYRADPAFMERLRVWLRGKRTELDQQLDRIGF